MSAPPDDFLAFLEAQRREYGAQLPARVAALEALWAAVRAPGGAAQLPELERAAHSLAGSAGTFGFAQMGAASKALEMALQRFGSAHDAPAAVESALSAVRSALAANPS